MKMLSISKTLAAATVALGIVAAGNAAAQEQTIRVGTVSCLLYTSDAADE